MRKIEGPGLWDMDSGDSTGPVIKCIAISKDVIKMLLNRNLKPYKHSLVFSTISNTVEKAINKRNT